MTRGDQQPPDRSFVETVAHFVRFVVIAAIIGTAAWLLARYVLSLFE